MLSKIFSILIGAVLAVAFHFWKENPATTSAPFAPLQDTSIAEMEITRMLQTQLEANTRAEGVPLAKRICFIDLDMIIYNDISFLADYEGDFCLLNTDDIKCENSKEGYNSSVIIWRNGICNNIYNFFLF